MPQNARVTAFTVCKLLRENQQGGSKLTNNKKKISYVNFFKYVT